jgi:hypothetical protein
MTSRRKLGKVGVASGESQGPPAVQVSANELTRTYLNAVGITPEMDTFFLPLIEQLNDSLERDFVDMLTDVGEVMRGED